MSNWIHIDDQKPQEEQDVFYFFEVLGVYKGKYQRITYPEEFVGKTEEPIYGDCFYGKKGFLTDDVTHWMPAPSEDCELPDIPEDYIEIFDGEFSEYAHKDEVVTIRKDEYESLKNQVKYLEAGHLTGLVCPVHTHIHIYHDEEKDGYWCHYCEKAYDTQLVEEDSYKFESKYSRPCPHCNQYEEKDRYKGGHLEYNDVDGLAYYICDKCCSTYNIGENGTILI